MTDYAYVFPGQGSQSVGMMTAWQDDQSTVDEVFDIASEILGYDLGTLVGNGPEAELNRTEVTQPAMLCAGVASWRIASSRGGMPAATVMAGHSLGEYTALVCAGSIELGDAVGLVARRGQLMQSAVVQGEGAMAVIIGLDDEDVIEACARVENGVVEAANFNAPGQVAIAGETAAVERAMQNAQEMGARRAMPIPVSVPSHCSLMRGAADALGEELTNLKIEMPTVPVIHNQNAAPASSPDEIRERLGLQLYQPVRWVACVEAIHARGVAGLIECGPGKVLTGLTRRIEKSLQGYAVYDAASLASSLQSLEEV
ncbi:MAG TPA: ACP S-malonyltransferase [Gammaproteobacteria bacterium]|nr:ACP S-malonyltransferase [Gammaproteobacteria bacterium]